MMFNNKKYYLDATKEFEEFEQGVLRILDSLPKNADGEGIQEVEGFILDKSKSGLGILDEAIWAKAKALKEGDEEKAKYEYISLRSQSLLKNALTDPKQLEVYYPYSNLAFIFMPALIVSFVPGYNNLEDWEGLRTLIFVFFISGLLPFIAADALSRLAAIFFSDKEDKSVLMRKKCTVILTVVYIVGFFYGVYNSN